MGNDDWIRDSLANEMARHLDEQGNGWAGPSGTFMQVRREPARDQCHSIAVWPLGGPILDLQSTVRLSQVEALDKRWPNVWYVNQQEYGFLGGKFHWKIIGYLGGDDLHAQARERDGFRPRVDIAAVDLAIKQGSKYVTDALGPSTHDIITIRAASALVGHYASAPCKASFAWPCVTGKTTG
ncbi:hypothetical protein [Streptomyces sp. NBC_00572]|uniref:hypothetical protein n=1 Tax=Streptomyces sp. NBC_00572 TaxID=2903664 RepID=UPI00225127ED|nr:hypothetical protein [Streptomyces sp. NBC_00572]MCX4986001.1 hypothetical protein [Streptomyces sp. NBC_00572]